MVRRRIEGIEGLRAVAALTLLAYHVLLFGTTAAVRSHYHGLLSLRLGVVLFFALSGYLLYAPIAAAIVDGTPHPSVRRYAIARALRILPAYWMALAVTNWVLQTAVTPPALAAGRIDGADTLFLNFVLLQNYSASSTLTGIGPAWSLAVEMTFYAALPLLGLLAGHLRLRGSAWLPVALLAVVGVTTRLWLAHGHASSLIAATLVANGDLFAAGMAVAVIAAMRRERPLPGLITIAGLLALLAVGVAAPDNGGRVGGGIDLAAACCFALILAGIVMPAGRAAVNLLERRPLVALGRWSYGIFLWHTPLLFLIIARLDAGRAASAPRTLALLAAVVALSVGVSAASYRFVEAPALSLKRGLSGRRQGTLRLGRASGDEPAGWVVGAADD